MKKRRYMTLLIFGLVLSFGSVGAVMAAGATPRLGLDLEGGLSVILTAEGDVRGDVLDKTVEIIRQRIDALGVAEPEVSAAGDRNILIQLPGVEDQDQALELIGTTAQLTFRQVKDQVLAEGGRRNRDVPEVTEETGDEVTNEEVVYPSAEDPNLLYVLEAAELTGEVVERAEAVTDPTSGQWFVSIEMNREGAEDWAEFTDRLACLRDEGEQVKSQVAIVLDGIVESAAGMQDPASSPDGGVECGVGITGGETRIDAASQEEAQELALVLRTGALPITLEQSEVRNVSPTLGRDSLETGLFAGAIGLALVMIYVVIYYRALGLVIWLGFVEFSLLMYAVLSILGETAGLALTLAGIAGIIVSIGIAADSFIVAFERLKDEVRSGKSIRAAVERGSTRAIRTILVADFVTGAAAVILFFLAVGPVRGFALTLGLATLVDVLMAFVLIRPAMVLLGRTKLLAGAAVGDIGEMQPAGAGS